MTQAEAEALELFVKDHDTRYTATVVGEGKDVCVQLTAKDGQVLDPVRSAAEYEQRFLTPDPGPTIREAWAKWGQ